MHTSRAALYAFSIIILAALVAGPAQAARTDFELQSLRGLNNVYLIVQSSDKDVWKDGLSKDIIRADIRQKVEAAGIKVVNDAKDLDDGGAILLVAVSSVKSDSGLYAANVDAELIQATSLARNPKVLVPATTWTSGIIALIDGNSVSRLRERIGKLIDAFILDYQSANLPISGTPKVS